MTRKAQSPTSPLDFDYAAQWADDGTEELTLPSGAKVVVHRPDLLSMAREGRIPDALTPLVEKFILGWEATNGQPSKGDQLPPEDDIARAKRRLRSSAEFARYADVFVVGACVRPRVVFENPAPGEVPVDRLDPNDRLHIYRWSEGLLGNLKSVPDDAGGAEPGVQAVVDGAGTPPAPESADRADAAD